MALPMCLALFGGSISVPTIGGSRVLRVPPGTTSGDYGVMRGKGIHDASSDETGAHFVHFEVELPDATTMSGEQRRLLAEYAKLESAPRAKPSAEMDLKVLANFKKNKKHRVDVGDGEMDREENAKEKREERRYGTWESHSDSEDDDESGSDEESDEEEEDDGIGFDPFDDDDCFADDDLDDLLR